MSSAGAGIGYALATAKEDYSVVENQLLLGSLLLWALSFLAGLWSLRKLGEIMNLSKSAMDFRDELPNAREAHQAFSKVVNETAAPLGSSLSIAAVSQVFLLVLGAVLYVFVRIDVTASIAALYP